MTKVVEINSFNRLSTGNIMLGIAEVARENGYEVYTFNPDGKSQRKNVYGNYTIGNRYERLLSKKINYYTGNKGSLNFLGTRAFINKLDKIKPDIIHLHNLHDDFVNLKLLFNYINDNNIKVVWTLHDCWAFTGHCPYFDIAGCYKWKDECHDCIVYNKYPETKKDNSNRNFKFKKELFSNVKSMTIVTPSQWLADLVKQSFLNKYPIKVIFNGIDLNKFMPRKSNFRKKYGLENKFIVLGVASAWGKRKGQDRFEEIAKQLDDRFKMVLVGIDQDLIKSDNIICIKRTDNQEQLAEIYTSADVLLNPTREDNFPTVNIEALACGTPVLSYGAGGSAEAFDERTGAIVSDETILDVLDKLYYDNFKVNDCLARGKQFEQKTKFKEYIELYSSLTR